MMNRDTGLAMAEDEHIRQSIRDILTTPVGSRLMRRDYGSLIPELIDHPANPANNLRMMNASVMAILKFEPRVSANSVSLTTAMDGSALIDLDCTRRGGPRTRRQITLTIPIR